VSIDGVIRQVSETACGEYVLHLQPRRVRYDATDEETGETEHLSHWQLAGQNSLTILHPTWKPEPMLAVWGNAGTVIIESQPPRQYERIGYTRLRERGSRP
jgi:hypothetical protein